MAFFRVTLRYSCRKHHANRVERIYEEADQKCVSIRVRRDKLVCYGCEPPKRINPPSRVGITFVSHPISVAEFERLAKERPPGSDYNVEVFNDERRKQGAARRR
jgi:hypothetical protein